VIRAATLTSRCVAHCSGLGLGLACGGTFMCRGPPAGDCWSGSGACPAGWRGGSGTLSSLTRFGRCPWHRWRGL
jgi:hypothetical protein